MKAHTEQDYRRRIAQVVEAILIDPAAPHTVDSLAAFAHLSSFHFHRIYRAITGESVAVTVKRVRLARAAQRLADAKESVTSIALSVGYDSAQTFARAFRDFTGLTPSVFSQRQRDLGSPPGNCQERALRALTLREMPPMEVLCLRHAGPVAGIPHSYQTLLRLLGGHPWFPRSQCVGIAYGDPEDKDGFTYFAGLLPPESVPAPMPLEAVRVEGGLYAAYRLIGPYALIAPTFQTLFGQWLPQSGYEPDHRPVLELYVAPDTSESQSNSVTDLLIPIRGDPA
ncbi:AraC family transcriptional regulator [Dyella choica]|uniref:AraC family transcriptional regulator n=2 Tax=Dyella choica TaxID=1927959 RepID=A0A3S0RJK0_9GAMM|nr:AraC family transcriptional regulator [Dyella choica]